MKKTIIVIAVIMCCRNAVAQGLFGSDSVLQLKLTGDIRALVTDRDDDAKEHPLTLVYVDDNGAEKSLNISSRTRGNFRRKLGGCGYPPLMLLFNNKDSVRGTLFSEQRKLKLVMPCKGDELVVREYMAYRIYNLLTPMSFRARLVRLVMEDTKRNKTSGPFYAMLLEEEHQMATRNNMVSIDRGMSPKLTDPSSFHRMAIFEYFIGNTDWSVEYLQNVKLLAMDSLGRPHTVPYDFDHSGLVSASYAKPAEELQMSNVRERRYRGYCLPDIAVLEPFINELVTLRDKINSIYESASYLDDGSKKFSRKFIDDFYAIMNDKQRRQWDLSYPCNKNGTGNVIIGGLKKDN